MVHVGYVHDTEIDDFAKFQVNRKNDLKLIRVDVSQEYRHSLLDDLSFNIRLIEPFCDLHEDMVTRQGVYCFKALICYLNMAKKPYAEVANFMTSLSHLYRAITQIVTGKVKSGGPNRQEMRILRSCIVPSRVFREDLPHKVRFTPIKSHSLRPPSFHRTNPDPASMRNGAFYSPAKRSRHTHEDNRDETRKFSSSQRVIQT